ncbi:MAG: hypothetical protein ACR2O0_07005, partial [Rhizobiaceae bacterium]
MKMIAIALILVISSVGYPVEGWGQAPIAVPTPRPDGETSKPERDLPADPVRIYQASCPALLEGKVTGRVAPPISEDQCGEKSPLAITALNGESVIG